MRMHQSEIKELIIRLETCNYSSMRHSQADSCLHYESNYIIANHAVTN